jgi:dihydrofolate reductase
LSTRSIGLARGGTENRHDKIVRANMVKLDIIIVAAVAENGVIGRGNALPWRLKSDMAHFRALTMGKPVVLGRKTFASIGKPLPGRTTIAISRDENFSAAGIVVAPNLDAGLAAARGDALRRKASAIIVAGGADIYVQALPLATRLIITEVRKRVDGDTRFPAIDPQIWRETARSEHEPGPQDEAAFASVTYERAVNVPPNAA